MECRGLLHCPLSLSRSAVKGLRFADLRHTFVIAIDVNIRGDAGPGADYCALISALISPWLRFLEAKVFLGKNLFAIGSRGPSPLPLCLDRKDNNLVIIFCEVYTRCP